MLLTAEHGSLAAGNLPGGCPERELAAAGFDAGLLAAEDRHLLRLLAQHDLTLELRRLPPDGLVWLAVLADGEACVGTGWRPADAVRGCLGEFAEYRSWLARGDEAVRLGLPADQPHLAVLAVADLQPFSPEQIELRDVLNQAWAGIDRVPSATAAAPVWCELECLHAAGSRALAPAAFCYGKPPPAWSGKDALLADSNGCAAGPDAASATLAALLEVVERDAAAVWWYAACPRPALVLDGLAAPPELARALAARREPGRQCWLLDLTHDLGIPVVAAVSLGSDGRLPAVGFGAAFTVGDAASAAYLELCQAEVSLQWALRRWAGRPAEALARRDRVARAWFEQATVERLPWLRPEGVAPAPCDRQPANADQALAIGLNALCEAGLGAYRLDLTRPDIGMPVVKVVVPGACQLKPRLAAARLVQVPVKLGWRPHGFARRDLQGLPLLA